MQVLPPREWLAKLLSSTGTKLHRLPMAGVASLARSLLMLGVRPPPAWRGDLLQQIKERWQQAGPESLSLLLLALQALEVGSCRPQRFCLGHPVLPCLMLQLR
jgi:hypothetical protein